MKRIILATIALAMALCLFAGCKATNPNEEAALADGVVAGSSQNNAGAGSDGPQKVEDKVTSSNDYDTSLGANQDLTPNTNAGNTANSGNTGNTGNAGNNNAGNTGSAGNTNPGDTNTGDANTGDTNTGDANTGDTNTGDPNPGDANTGDTNTGDTNTGDTNTGDTNTGDTNTGDEDPYAAMKADTSGTKIKILNQNLRCDATADKGTDNDARLRRYRFQTLVEKYDPDIISGQECDATWIDFLEQDYGATYDMFYKYREDGNDEACPVLWKKDKYEKLDQGYFWLSKTPNVSSPSYEEGQMARITNWVYLKDKATGSKFYIYSAHYGFYNDNNSIASIRDQVINAFKKVPDDAYAFHMGDYNFGVEGEQYYVYTDAINIIDMRIAALEMEQNGHCTMGDIRNGTYNGFKPENADGAGGGDFLMAAPRKNQTIDFYGYLYEQPGNEKAGVQEGYVADHFAIYSEVRIDTDLSYQEYWGENAR